MIASSARLLLVVPTAALVLLSADYVSHAPLLTHTDVNLAKKHLDDTECAIAKNPANPLQLFALCNNASFPGLLAARSTDAGVTWTYPDPADKTIGDGDAGQGYAAFCDPNLAWDSFGNLFLTYISQDGSRIATVLSTDGGATFTNLASFGTGYIDQPSIAVANTSAAGAPVAVWIVWHQNGVMVARGAAVTGLGTVATFGPVQTVPGTTGCTFGDVAIAPSGAVVQVCQSPADAEGPSTVWVNTDADGLGPNNFGPAVAATSTNVGGFDFIPAQSVRSVDAETGLAFDANPASAHSGRLYLVYTEETQPENNDTDIMVRFSDDIGATWSAPIRVNDDPSAPIRSQFLPKIAANPTGEIAVCWYDARNSSNNRAAEEFCSLATGSAATPSFLANARVSDGASTSNAVDMDFGDYSGLAYVQGVAHPIWGDISNSTGDNPDGTSNFDAYTDRVNRVYFSICITRPIICNRPILKPNLIVINCTKLPCVFQDFIPRNCLIKFVCPGCPPGAMCPPEFIFGIEGLDPAWHVELYDPKGQLVDYHLSTTRTGMALSFRPKAEYFKDGKIGNYFFTFETDDRSQLGKTQSIRMTVRAGNQPSKT